MMLEEMLGKLPKLVAVMGEKWLWQNRAWAEPFIGQRLAWYDQLEGDLRGREKITGTTPLIERYSVRDAGPSDPPEVSDAEGVAP